MNCYILASTKTWNVDAFALHRKRLPGRWLVITDPRDLTPERLVANAPRYIFFMHWSAKVTDEILNAVECVCFQMTDVPYGRGGSPLQNLILAGHTETVLSALRMTSQMDAGPVYMKAPMSLRALLGKSFAGAQRLAFR
jgi:methionyl-tRNA formyltransferase